jgi:tetratricopeptide (TPR) repeat protein
LQPNFVPALEGTAQVEYASGDPRAWASLERILTVRPGNETAHAMLGALAFERGDCVATVSHFEKSGNEVGQNAKALAQFGYCLISTNQADRATEIFKHLLLLRPSDPQARFNLGLAQFLSHDQQGAIATLGPLAAGPPPDPDALNLVAQAYEADHQTEAAVAALRKATEIAPKDVRNYLDLATLCMDHGAYTLGIEIVEVGIKNIPDSASLYAMRGILRAQTTHFDEAESDFHRANQLQPDQVYGTVGLGITFMQRGNPEDSVRILRERLARNPQDPVLNYLFAEALLFKGIEPGTPEFDEAKAALLRSIMGKPDFAMAHAQLSKLYLLAGDTAKALEESELAVQLAPEDRMAVYSLVRALKESGRNEEAKPLLLKLREIDARELKEEADKNRVKLVRAAPPHGSKR